MCTSNKVFGVQARGTGGEAGGNGRNDSTTERAREDWSIPRDRNIEERTCYAHAAPALDRDTRDRIGSQ